MADGSLVELDARSVAAASGSTSETSSDHSNPETAAAAATMTAGGDTLPSPPARRTVAELVRREISVIRSARALCDAEAVWLTLTTTEGVRGYEVAAARRRMELAQVDLRNAIAEYDR